jgi:DNA (cytosine-5)-methyltransferase 1
MRPLAYYNEIDPYAAEWLRNLIKAGRITPGVVDERDIRDIAPIELAGFTQCHFFAGIGVWSYALDAAGWPDDRQVWTGSCPCQPFSAAGKGGGFSDERHLWPAFEWLIGQCRPDVVFGEQVEGPAGRQWLDLVLSDLEGNGYACGTAVFPASGVGAPHRRHRTYWLADAELLRKPARRGQTQGSHATIIGHSDADGLAHADQGQRGRIADGEGREPDRLTTGWHEGDGRASGDCEADLVGHAELYGSSAEREFGGAAPQGRLLEYQGSGAGHRPGPVNGFWRASDWLYCRDDKWRPVEPGTFPLAHGTPARVGRLRAYGNAICAQQAQAFIEAAMSANGERIAA